MASRYEVEVTVGSARDLKNVNWRNGDLKPYAVLWVDAGSKCSTRVVLDHDDSPVWDEKLTVPLPPSAHIQDAILYLDVIHANAAPGVKPLVGSALLPLRDVVDDAGMGGRASRNLRLKRPSGRPHGRLDVRVAVREPSRYYDPNPYPAPAYAAGGAYGAPPPATAAGAGGYAAYGSAPQPAYVAPYGATAPPVYDAMSVASSVNPKKKKKKGMGTGLAVGAAAGFLGGLALAGGARLLRNKFEDEEDFEDDDDDDSFASYEDDDDDDDY